MAVSELRRLAAQGRVPVFAAIGRDAWERVEDFAQASGIERVASPRHAGVLLVAGRIRDADREPLHRLHDQLPHPRATLWWGADPEYSASPVRVPEDGDPRAALNDLYRQLLAGRHPTEPHLLPDEPPNPWRGRGDHGQGGEGMMGGTPYGRPMPMPPQEDLRDGLALDAYTTRIGPFLPWLPPGLVLEATLQGDVLQHAEVVRAPLPPTAGIAAPFRRALQKPVPVAEMERARAGHHLRCIARLLAILQLLPQAERCLRMAWAAERGEPVDVRTLRRMLKLTGTFTAVPPGLGRLDPHVAAGLGGAARRAAGEGVDAREGHPAYRAHGFRTITQDRGDVRARLKQWLDEAEQALRLASPAASGAPVEHHDRIESPWGELPEADRQFPPGFSFADLLAGLEWGEAMLVIASFDVASLRCMSATAETAAEGA